MFGNEIGALLDEKDMIVEASNICLRGCVNEARQLYEKICLEMNSHNMHVMKVSKVRHFLST